MKDSLNNDNDAVSHKEAAIMLGYGDKIETMLTHAQAGLIPCHRVLVEENYRTTFFRAELEAYLSATYSGPDWLDIPHPREFANANEELSLSRSF